MASQAALAAQLDALRAQVAALTAQVAKIGVEELRTEREIARPAGVAATAIAETLRHVEVVAQIDGVSGAARVGAVAVRL